MNSQTRLFVGNLPENTNENDVQKAFSTFGEITNLDIKCKSSGENPTKSFAFITISTSAQNIESCIKHFSNSDYNGSKLYVTRARESFLERLQRERSEAQQNAAKKHQEHESIKKKNPVIKLSEKLNPRKRKINENNPIEEESKNIYHQQKQTYHSAGDVTAVRSSPNKKKQDSEQKRIESMKKKRQEFKQKQNIIKHGLIAVDSKQNKKTLFSDSDDESVQKNSTSTITDISYNNTRLINNKKELFNENDEEDDDTVNFKIKEQFEGKKGQKVLDLQSRYKSDKRFILDERFVEDDQSEEEKTDIEDTEENNVDVGQTDEKTKQLNILQDVLGVPIKSKTNEPVNNKKTKTKMGMLRFDPLQPEHAKFLAPVKEKLEPVKTSKKKKSKDKQEEEIRPEEHQLEVPKVEVSKEQFYKVSETLKETIVQPTTFSLRSLFGTKNVAKDEKDESNDYIPLEPMKRQKKRNPLEPGERNPFVYDSSDSEPEENDTAEKVDLPPQATDKIEPKHVWQENLFFTETDERLKEGLKFFLNTNGSEGQKERRELKSLMKKRIYNKERKNQMFQKKIGGKRGQTRKNFRKKM